MYVGDVKAVLGFFEEDASVVDRLGHALDGEEVAVVCGFPDAAGVSAAGLLGHVACDAYVVRGSCGVVRGVVAVLR